MTSIIWFQRVMWAGILVNVALAVPTLLWPARMLELSGLPPSTPLLWVRFAGLLLILLTTFYVPAAQDPVRSRTNARLAVLARLVGTLFFATQARDYWMLGAIDFVFFVPEAILLRAVNRS